MGTYNTASVRMCCPRCRRHEQFDVSLYDGYTAEMLDVPLGGLYPVSIRGDSPAEVVMVRGYTECPRCGRDFHCLATVTRGLLESVEPDLEEPPLVPDIERQAACPCPVCGSTATRLQVFNGYSLGRLICDEATCLCHRYVGFETDGRPGAFYERTNSPWSVSKV